jgi:hypothetical protein
VLNPKRVSNRCEYIGRGAGIEEFDLKRSVFDVTLLPDELIETRVSDFARAVRCAINSTVAAQRGAVQQHLKTNQLIVLCRTSHQVQVAAVEPEHNLTGCCRKHSALGADVPRSAQCPLIQSEFCGRAVGRWRVLRQSFRRCKTLGAIIADVAFGRSLIPNARRCLDSGGGYANDVPAQAGGSVFLR